jgi:type VI secretion system Hcp family effector
VSSQIFLKIVFANAGHVKGECTYRGFEDWIECNDLTWKVEGRDVKRKSGTNHRRIKMDPLTIHKSFDDSSVKLLNCMKARDKIVRARFAVAHRVKTSDELREAFALELESGLIEEVDWDLAEGRSLVTIGETLKLSYSRIKVEYAPMNANGSFSNVKKTFSTQVDDALDLGDLFGDR